MPDPIICDTSVWLYLGRIGQTTCLDQLYHPVYTIEAVCRELDIGRISRPTTSDPRTLAWVRLVQPDAQELAALPANRLGPGEQSVLAYAAKHAVDIVGLDDRQARLLAQQLGVRTIGTLGVLLRAKDAGLIATSRPLLDDLQREGSYISDALRHYALRRAGEA